MLKDPLAGIGGQTSGRLNDSASMIRNRFNAGASATGRPASPYFDQQFGQAQAQGQRGIEDSLYGVLGNASYKDQLAVRDHQRKMALAKMIGGANKPSTLQEVLGGIGAFAPAMPALAGGAKSLYNSMGTSGASNSLPSSLSLFNNSQTGPGRYGL
jgi:hypothetical protein